MTAVQAAGWEGILKKQRAVCYLLMCGALSISACNQARAWSGVGHRVVADIAERYLDEGVRQTVAELLQSEAKERLRDVATWADEMRDLDRPRQPSHSIRLPLTSDTYSQKRDCRNKNCILEAIKADLAVLSDPRKTLAARAAALKYLTHLVGDLHQPLHASVDSGQQEVMFAGRKMTLHAVWDRGLIQCQIEQVESLAARSKRHDMRDVDVVSWAETSRNIARDQIFVELLSGRQVTVLAQDYCARFGPIVLVQLEKAGQRLANLLNTSLRRAEFEGNR